MFAKLQLCLIFSLLFISSISRSMRSDDPIDFESISRKFNNMTSKHDSYQCKGEYNKPKEVDSEFNRQLIETASNKIKLLILGLQDRDMALENSCLKRLLLYGEPGNGKTSLARAIGITAFKRYYYVSAPSLLTSWKNCHQDLRSEINPLILKGESIAIIVDEMDCITNQYKNRNSSDESMPAAFWSLLDYCEREAPFLFFIGTTNNEKEDFPEPLISRFEGSMIYIPNPDLPIRMQIMNTKFNGKQTNITDEDKRNILDQLGGRSCRNIVKILDTAILYSLNTNKVITREVINLAIEENPRSLSKYQRLAQRLGSTEEEIRELAIDKVFLEKNNELIEFFYKKRCYDLQRDSFNQATTHHDVNLIQSERHHNATIEQNNNHHNASFTQSGRQHTETIQQGTNHHQESLAQADRQHNATIEQGNNHHNASYAQLDQHYIANFNQAIGHHNANLAQSVASHNQAAAHHNATLAQATLHHNASMQQTAFHHQDNNHRQDVDTIVDGVTTGVRNGVIGGVIGGPTGALLGVVSGVGPALTKVYFK